MKLPSAFTRIPSELNVCNDPTGENELALADSVRKEYLIEGQGAPWMVDVVRGFRLANKSSVYIEVGTQDKGNIAWVSRTKLIPGATIIDIDMLDYPINDRRIRDEMYDKFDYHAIRGNCLSSDVLKRVEEILGERKADFIFCDSHYTYEHTLEEFSLYFPIVKNGGFLVFHDAQWPGNPNSEWDEMRKRGKGPAIEQLDRFYPAWMCVNRDIPLHRPMPSPRFDGHWGTLAIFPRGLDPEDWTGVS